jgi:hypothetical protein
MARGLPDGVTVAQLFLVQFVLVRIQVRQPKKKKPQRKLRFFYARRDPSSLLEWSDEGIKKHRQF